MKNIIVIFIVSIAFVHTKVYNKCELARELYHKHNLSKDTIGYHVCIAAKVSKFDTRSNSSSHLGLYGIGMQWWCSDGKAGNRNRCNIECSNLINDDITDDVECATEIINRMGTKAWNLNPDDCEIFRYDVINCLKNTKIY